MRSSDDTVDDDLGLAWEEDEPRPGRGGVRTRQFRRQRQEKRRRKGRAYVAVVISAALLAVLGLVGFWGLSQLRKMESFNEYFASDYDVSEMGEPIAFRVQEGDGGTTIAVNLLEAGVIRSRTAFVNVCESRSTECQAIQPGSYMVRLRSPAETVFNVLIDPANKDSNQITIREGLTVIEVLPELAQQTGLPLADFQAAAANPAALGITPEWYQRENGKPNAVEARGSIEGFLFPDTYFYDPTATAQDILKMMVDQFFSVAARLDIKGRADFLGISPYDVVTTASLVQAEGLEPDFAKIARVAYNRAYKDMISCDCLQFDSTARYWLEVKAGTPQAPGPLTGGQLNDPSNPYNTYDKTPGMPLGPIGNPGEAALDAAANPADGDWLYFVVVRPDGTTKFAATHDEHCDNVREGINNGVDLDPNC
jgi:UPF0755 protein